MPVAGGWALQGLALALWLPLAAAFVLEGSQTSYAQFRKWNAALNGSLEFEFKTEQANGLLLYTDDGGTYDFFEIKLVEGALRLRYNLGGGAQILTVGRDLNDGHWHKVQVRRNVETTTLTVDGVTQSRTARGKEFMFGRLASNSDVYIGGMPSWYNSKLTLLALPSVIFEPRFGGAIRNLVYADEDSPLPRRQEMRLKDYKCGGFQCPNSVPHTPRSKTIRGIRGNLTDACEEHDPCQHGGICISTDSGPICECRNLDYEGIFCEKDKAPSEATFRGLEFLWYDLGRTGGEPIVSAQDSISLMFKTRHPTGLLFHTGDGDDYLNLVLKDGGVLLTMSLGSGKVDLLIKPNRVRFDDNQWHKLTVHRRVQEISAVTSFCRLTAAVDGVYSEHTNTAGTFTMLSSSRVYVGGSENTISLPGSRIHANFIGCLRKVEFTADTLKLNIVELGRTGSKMIAISGHMDFMCQEVEAADPITFTTQDAHLVVPAWEATRSGSISLKIRTVEADGLLIYSSGARSSHLAQADLFALELVSGHLYLHLDLGSGAVKVKGTTRRVDDGTWHEVMLRRNGREGRLTVDENAADFSTPGESNQLDLEGGMYLGGLGASPHPLPPALWSAVLGRGYVGCLRDFVVDGKALDLAEYARHQDSSSIQPACHSLGTQCDSQPCMNSGVCSEGWNRFVCDCSTTAFAGPTCGKEATTLSFNGSQHMVVLMPQELRSQTEDVRLRFRTTRPLGLLVTTAASTEQSGDRLSLALNQGRVKLTIRIGDKEKTILSGQGLNDNQWHSVSFSRRASNLNLQVDDEAPIRVETLLGKQSTLEMRSIHVGGVYHMEEEAQVSKDIPSFVGSMQQFRFNGQPYFEIARSTGGTPAQKGTHFSPEIHVTANFSKRDHQLVHHPVTFKSKHTFVGLPVLKAYSQTNIYFQFKTRESGGIILYNAGREQDFIAVELVSGHLHYIFNLGDGPVRVRDNARASLNDNKWHTVTIGRPSPKQHTLMVDDTFAIVTSLGMNEKLDLAGILYLGGVPKDISPPLPKQIQSRNGFEGCLASLDLNGESPNLVVDAVIPSSLVSAGCEGQSTKCSHNVCANRGVCVQQWNSYTCDCDMTSYTGPTCSDESIAYEFGPNRGLITYVFPEDRRPEMKSDVLALGFVTTKEDAVLFRVDSGTSNDYMELEIVDGNIYMVYNMGTNDHPIGEISVKVIDNTYHVVRFTRSGANSTIQVDDYNVQINHPKGHQLSVFNSQAQIQVGGRWNRAKQRVERPFGGVMAGLVFNGLRVLDLAAESDPRTEVRGDVTLLTGIRDRLHEPLQRMQQTPASGFPGVQDDLVFSGAGSGCNADDEDQCTPVFETGSGDDLITPVYVPPTRPPSTTRKPGAKEPTREGKPCDDEDCFDGGSGSGEPGGGTTTETGGAGGTTGSGTESSTGGTGTEQTSSSSSGSSPGSAGPDLITPEVVTDGSRGTSYQPPSTTLQGRGDTGHPSTTERGQDRSSTTTTTTTEHAPPPPPPPPPPSPSPFYPMSPSRTNRPHTSSRAAENTAIVIGIIAGTMIAIIIIILLVLKLRNRSDGVYKVDETKTYHASQGQSAALLANTQSPPTPQAVNGNLKNGKGRQVKDIKEWYV